MSEADEDGAADRRSQIVGRLVQQYQSAADPDKWLQTMTLQALRALDRADLTPVEKSPARREIHAIHREVAVKARALKLSRSLVVITADRSDRTTTPEPTAHPPKAGS